jgi:MYXO-CTERM domain-containing protein
LSQRLEGVVCASRTSKLFAQSAPEVDLHRRHASLLAIGLFALPALTGCAPAADEERLAEAIGNVGAAIEGGYPDDFDTHAVGIVHVSNFGFGACSGTLIAPNVVLTAHHCVSNTSSQGVICNQTGFSGIYNAAELFITTKPSFTQNIADYHAVAEIVLPPDGPLLCGRDQAIIILADPIGPEEAIPASPRVDEPLTREEYYAVGYGERGEGGPSGARYRRDDLTVQCVGADCGIPNSLYPAEWRGDTAVCSGDSGGPAFDMSNRVAGVASRGASGCELPVYGDVFSWGWWIKDVTLYASGLLGAEPPPWATGWPTDPAFSHPVGGACSTAEECPSNICLDGYCTRLCNEAAPCSDGFECNTDGFCEKVPEPPPPSNSGDDDDDTTVSSCSYGDTDPTKPIPWKTAPLLLGALALVLRRRRRG